MSEPTCREPDTCCACLSVRYAPEHNDDGSITERWACPVCQADFVRIGRLHKAEAEIERLRAALEEIAAEGCPYIDCSTRFDREEWCGPCIARAALAGEEGGER
jgi:hypothetical protein